MHSNTAVPRAVDCTVYSYVEVLPPGTREYWYYCPSRIRVLLFNYVLLVRSSTRGTARVHVPPEVDLY